MKSEYSEIYFLSANETNPEGEMALQVLVSKLIDIATAHANSLGIGNPDMPDPDMGWVLSRLSVEMTSYPRVNDTIRITTWVESFNRHFSQRAFAIEDEEGKVYGYARSIWMVLNTKTRANAGLGQLQFDQALISGRECPIPKQAKHEKIECETAATYRFTYCDIDAYRHVNTVRYVQLLLNQKGLPVYDANRVSRLELSFLHEARYDETIRIHSSGSADGMTAYYLEDADDSHPILYARIFLTPRS